MSDCQTFPDTVEEFMENYKIVDSKQIYTNGIAMVPIFRMKQWFEHLPPTQPKLSMEMQEILNYLDTALHPIVSPENWYVYAELHDMVSKLSSSQPLVLTCDGCKYVGTYDTDFPCSRCIRREKDYYVQE